MIYPLDFLPQSSSGGQYVIAQLGQSLDGRIATDSGESRYISQSHALDHLHRLRAHVDAVIVGVSTVLIDDPLLTVRRIEGQSPARVILDPRNRLPATARCLRQDGTRVCVFTSAKRKDLQWVDLIEMPVENEVFLPQKILSALMSRGLKRVLVEGGSRTISGFIDAGCVDRMHISVSPVIIGSGRAALQLSPINSLNDALRPKTIVHIFPDGDVLFDCDLRTSLRSERTADA